jgi:SAM-dependent methyltransferase
MENMARCIDLFAVAGPQKVVDLGAMNVNGSYKQLLPDDAHYIGVDLEAGPGVDVVLDDVYQLPFEDGSVDLVLSGQMLEHCAHFWLVFNEIHRILKPGGMAFMIAPSSGPVHRYPLDCYRFYPDSFAALANWSGLRLVQSWTDERGPWRDLVGIFQKGGTAEPVTEPRPFKVEMNYRQDPHPDPAVEMCGGARPYLEVLRDLHEIVGPQFYVEIGIRKGKSLALATGKAIAIDPDPHPDFVPRDADISFHRCTSDDFFFFHSDLIAKGSVDLAFLDGMHLAEYVFRDFMNIERVMRPNGVIVIDDVLPNHPIQADRDRQSQAWTGDVWRFVDYLAKNRPDLRLQWLDTQPSGLLLVTNPGRGNRAMWDSYNKAIRRLAETVDAPVPPEILDRRDALAPTLENLRKAVAR